MTPEPELQEIGIAELQEQMASGKSTARRIAEAYIARIDALDRSGPTLRAVIELNPDALAIAGALDEERSAAGPRGPLHGIPVLLKDNIGTADRMETSAGSLALLGARPARDSGVAARLRAAGCVLLGKTNLSEWANFRSTRPTSGWSARGGQVRNPYALDRSPSGSSSGSAVAVAADLAAVSVGTETDGSIVCPASANGVVGIKPTVGLVGRSGIVPVSHSQDTAGPMTRSVRDGAVLLGALAGIDPDDGATDASRDRAHADYTRFLDEDGLRGARIGVSRPLFGFHPAADAVAERALAALRDAGAVLVDPVAVPGMGDLLRPELEVMLYEFRAGIDAWLRGPGSASGLRSLEDLIDFNERHAEAEMPWFGQELFLLAQKKGSLEESEYREALDACRRLSRAGGIDAAVEAHRLEALVAPTAGPAWTTDLVNGDRFSGSSSTLAAVAGYPSISVPAGEVFGLPVGLSFFGPAWSEPTLLRLAFAFERRTAARHPPRYLERVPSSRRFEGGKA